MAAAARRWQRAAEAAVSDTCIMLPQQVRRLPYCIEQTIRNQDPGSCCVHASSLIAV